ncbi:hypothetical protein MKEN_00515100 [Mycena kentingensis (nom. inval.)]|nr:hypothetical protein MKEN_00515100 [Mycena kentingensis (nom. inval.)]
MSSLLFRGLTSTVSAVGRRGLLASTPVSRVVLNASTRRTFVFTPRLAFPAASTTKAKAKKPAAAKPKATLKGGAKKAAVKKAAPKRKPAAKKVVKPKVKKAAKPKPLPRIKSSEGPPRRGKSAYACFLEEYSKITEGFRPQTHAKACAEAWQLLSESEKAVWKERAAESKVKQDAAREKWFRNVDPKFLARLNKQRVKQGKNRYRNPYAERMPYNGFMRFYVHDFTPANMHLPVAKRSTAAGAEWRAMSASQKEPYNAAAKVAYDAYHAKKKA